MALTGLYTDINGRSVPAFHMSTRVQNVSYTGTAGTSTVFLAVNQDTSLTQDLALGIAASSPPAGTTHVRLCATSDCYVLFGSNPTATAANGTLLPAGAAEYFAVDALDKVSVIQVSAAGTLNITECQ